MDAGIAAQAGPCSYSGWEFPIFGRVKVDPSWERWSVANRQAVMRHELAHVLGIGSARWWDWLVDPTPEAGPALDTHFAGPRAVRAFNEAGGGTYTGGKVPVENTAGSRSSNGHWRNAVFGRGRELMTTAGGSLSATSAITLQALADLGYTVDLSFADPYTLPAEADADTAADDGGFIGLTG